MTGGRATRAKRRRRKPTRRTLLRHALIKGLVSTIIAALGAIFFYLSDLRFWGADLSQSVLVQFDGGALGLSPADGGTDAGLRAAPERWAFVDIGPRFCAARAEGRSICPPETARTDPSALARLLAWVVVQRPRVVVLDIEAIRDVEELRAVNAALPEESGERRTPILVALPFEPEIASLSGGQPVVVLDGRAAQLLRASIGTRLRFRPTLIQAPAPVARHLLTEVRITGDPELSRLDTISFAAALVARTPGDDPFAIIDEAEGGQSAGHCRPPVSDHCRTRFALTERFFSFRPAIPADDPEARNEADVRATEGLRSIYLPAPAIDRLDAQSAGSALADAVVVIGDSRIAAQDRPWTALGDVAGAEVHLNDIRQFTYLRPAPDSLGAYLVAELPLLLLGFFVVAGIEALLAWRRSKKPPLPVRSFRYPLAGLNALLLIAGTSGFLSYLYLYLFGAGGFTDIITPMVGLLTLTALEFLFRLAAWFEARFGMEH